MIFRKKQPKIKKKLFNISINLGTALTVKTIFLLAFFIFLAHFTFFYFQAHSNSGYLTKGKWILMDNYIADVTAPHSLKTFYKKLNTWDGQWYYDIAKNGYHCHQTTDTRLSNNPQKCNVSFFPFVPIMAKLLHLFGIPLTYALPLVSQIAYFFILVFLLLLLKEKQKLDLHHFALLLCVVSYPSSLYFFTPYAASSLCFFIVLVFYLTDKYITSQNKWILFSIVISGMLACLTKATGFIVMGIPFFMALFYGWQNNKKLFNPTSIKLYIASFTGTLGLFFFLLYCHVMFGKWNLYFTYAIQAWNKFGEPEINFNPLVIFTSFKIVTNIPISVSNCLMLFYFAISLHIILEAWSSKHVKKYLLQAIAPIFIAIYFITAINIATPDSVHQDFARHSLPLLILFSLFYMLQQKQKTNNKLVILIAVIAAIVLLALQGVFIHLFATGEWVS